MISINIFLTAFLIIYIFVSITDIIIDIVNERYMRRYGREIPKGFEGMIDAKKLENIIEYGRDNTRLTVVRTMAGKVLFLIIILSGILPWLSGIIEEIPYLLAGLIFFAFPGLLGAILDLPFNYFHIFVIEEKHGFNTRTIRIWISDLLKSLAIAVVLGVILLSLLLIMVRFSGNSWWIWAWLVFFSFQILILIIYPTVIAPIFNKFIPIQDNELEMAIRELSAKEGINVKEIFQMDAGRRSKHTNAYFAGLGKTKRIVLYDTLLKAHDRDEILAVLTHEIGHMKKGHIKKQLTIVGIASLILFFLASRMIQWNIMYESFGFLTSPQYVGLFLIAVIWEPVGFFLSPLSMALSRRFERDADHHVYIILENSEHLVRALKKMALDNLSNLHPHPLYVIFNYSHPPLLERIRNLEDMTKQDEGQRRIQPHRWDHPDVHR